MDWRAPGDGLRDRQQPLRA